MLFRRRLFVLYNCVLIGACLLFLYPILQANAPDGSDDIRNFTFSYQLTIDSLPSAATDLEIWIPFPLSDQYQQITRYEITSELPYEMYVDSAYGNNILYFKSSDRLPSSILVKIDYDVVRSENSSISKKTIDNQVSAEGGVNQYLSPNELIPIDGKISKEAEDVINPEMTTLEKVQALYNHLTETMRYDKTGDGWGNGDAIYACDYRKGNCTDIHSLFIGMARSLKIPARFVIGFPLPAQKSRSSIPGYHCWAEFYLDDRGWVPVDISEAIKHGEKKEYYFGCLDPNRISFTIGRDIVLQSGKNTRSLNYLIYPYVLVDGKPFADIDYSFDYKQM
jgi:transglutaminase-like putative cysteine protease